MSNHSFSLVPRICFENKHFKHNANWVRHFFHAAITHESKLSYQKIVWGGISFEANTEEAYFFQKLISKCHRPTTTTKTFKLHLPRSLDDLLRAVCQNVVQSASTHSKIIASSRKRATKTCLENTAKRDHPQNTKHERISKANELLSNCT
jgi:hypothetical protein